MATLHERIARAREALVSAGIDPSEAALDADLLARHVLGWDRARLLADARNTPPAGFVESFDALIARRSAREPVAYITGHREFWGLDFEVTPDVLTPRPETELIVEEAIQLFRDWKPGEIVDVGTGSGCLAVALAIEFPEARVLATDVSPAALDVARRNAKKHGVDRRIALIETDLLPSMQTADLIVSNPPYIPLPDAPSLAPEVRDHEPHVALYAGADGLEVYRRLLPEAYEHRSSVTRNGSNSTLILEVGYDQAAAVTDLATRSGWIFVRARHDLQGIARTLVFRSEDDCGE